MSLMNDALRKQNRERVSGSSYPGSLSRARLSRFAWKWIGGLVALVVLTVGVLYGYSWMPSERETSLLLKTPDKRPAGLVPPPSPASSAPTQPAAADTGPKPADGGPRAAAPAAEIAPPPASSRGIPAADSGATPLEGESPTERLAAKATTTRPQALGNPNRILETEAQPSANQSLAVIPGFEPGPAATANQNSAPHRPAEQTVHPPASDHQPNPARPRLQSERAPAGPPESHQGQAHLYLKALAYHRNGRLADAVRLYRKVLAADPRHAEAMLNLSGIYLQIGNYTDARRLLDRLERQTPRPAGVLLNQAIASIGLDEPDRALVDLDRAAAMSDASPWEIRFHRAVALARLNRHADALALYRAMVRERPTDPVLQFNLATTCDSLGLYRDALIHYNAAMQASSTALSAERETIERRMGILRRYLDGPGGTPSKQRKRYG